MCLHVLWLGFNGPGITINGLLLFLICDGGVAFLAEHNSDANIKRTSRHLQRCCVNNILPWIKTCLVCDGEKLDV